MQFTKVNPDRGRLTMLPRLATASFLALTLSFGSAGTASAASVTPASAVSAVSVSIAAPATGLPLAVQAQPVLSAAVVMVPKRTWAQKTKAFTKCIFLVGVPIGLSWAILTTPALLAWVMGPASKPLPVGVGGLTAKYMKSVKKNCGYALR